MKPLTLILSILFLQSSLVYSQQWVDKTFEYDSLVNITYGTSINFNGSIDSLQMDVFIPECTNINQRHPLLMWIHGGGFLGGDKSDPSIQLMCREFAKRGYVTASIDYRLGLISDELLWQCNYPNYECLFAADSAELPRAYYRAVQDAKGAVRFLINRHEEYKIDTSNVFVAGESAGALTALGVGLLDMNSERPVQTFALEDVSSPNPNTFGCIQNMGENFDGNTITRPDLGGIDGEIEPTNIDFTIKGIGNIYGAMLSDLLAGIPDNKPKPAIYSFHQPCDIIVPIDSNTVYWGLSWCFTNGYNCYGISNNETMLYGSRAFSNWNSTYAYGYDIQDEFTEVVFPFNFFFGSGSCLDQVENPCHDYDNRALRENNMAVFFAGNITSEACDSTNGIAPQEKWLNELNVYPNPTKSALHISGNHLERLSVIHLVDMLGKKIPLTTKLNANSITLDLSGLKNGLYILQLVTSASTTKNIKIVKN